MPIPLMTFLNELEDPRRIGACDHKLIDILMIAICTVISGGDSWQDMETYGQEKYDWLKTFLELSSGIPSHDTFYRIFCLLNPDKLQACFTLWVKSAFPKALSSLGGLTDIVPIDGKVIKGSRDKANGKRAIHMVSAWSANLGLVLAQKKVDKKSNEITAVPELLRILDIKGALITADAISCQKNIAKICSEQGADYLLAVKGNQATLQKDIQAAVELHKQGHPSNEPSESFAEQRNEGHGRQEYRSCRTFNNIASLSTHKDWQGIKQFGVVQTERTVSGKTTTAQRYYIGSKILTAEKMLLASRTHWQVENNLHWMLDITFNEDACQTKDENAAENLSTLRRIALNILKMDTKKSGSMRNKRKRAGWSNQYLAQLLDTFILGSV